MNFEITEDRRLLRDTVARFLLDKYPFEKRNEIAGSDKGYSPEIWSELAELGVIGALFSEEAGGFGGGGFDITVVFEEFGRALVVEPLLATLMAGRVLQAAGDNGDQLETVISGELQVAVALGEPSSRYDLFHVETTAEADGGGWRLTGRKSVVLNGHQADVLIIPARVAGDKRDKSGISLFAVAAQAEGIDQRGYATIDNRGAADLILENVQVDEANLVGAAGEGLALLEEAVAAGIVGLCAETMGAMEAAKDLTLDYLRTRKQFGVPIGKFQVLQHRMADVLIEMEQCRSSLINAAGHLDAGEASRDKHIAAAKNLFGRAGRLAAEEFIQMHGGIAMTEEYIVSHYAKRIIMSDHLLGDTDYHLQRFMALMK